MLRDFSDHVGLGQARFFARSPPRQKIVFQRLFRSMYMRAASRMSSERERNSSFAILSICLSRSFRKEMLTVLEFITDLPGHDAFIIYTKIVCVKDEKYRKLA
jgi:hypothetical protein